MNPNFLKKNRTSWFNVALATGSLFSMGTTPAYYRIKGAYQSKAQQYISQALPSTYIRTNRFTRLFPLDELNAPSLTAPDKLTLMRGQQVRELVIIDEAVPQKHLFYAQARPGIDIVELNASENGLSGLLDILAQYQGLDAVHLFSHASDGTLQLGGEQVRAADIQAQPEAFTLINQAIKPNGDFLFYGCELGKGEAGEAFLEIIQNHTHVDLAASDDLTGSSELEGDWELEIQRGNIESLTRHGIVDTDQFNETLQIVEKRMVGESGQPLITISVNSAISYSNSSSAFALILNNYLAEWDLPSGQTLNSVYLGEGTLRIGFEIGGGTSGNPLEANDFSLYFYLYNYGIGGVSQTVFLGSSLASSYDSTYFNSPIHFGSSPQYTTMPYTWDISSVAAYVNIPNYYAYGVYMAFAVMDNDNNGGNDVPSYWGDLKIYEFFPFKWNAGTYFDIVADYASDNSNPAPTVSDFENMAIEGVTASNLSTVNAIIDTTTSYNLGTQAGLQALVDNVNSSLPITLVDFQAERIGEAISLNWITANEQNNQGFEIQQSVDGETFERIGFVEGAGNSSKEQTYEFSVWNPEAAYYRFKQIDLDGQNSYSSTRFIEAWNPNQDPVIYPNPVSGEVFIDHIGEQETLIVDIFDLQGRQLFAYQGSRFVIQQQLTEQFETLPKGTYVIHMRTFDRTFTQRVVKE